MSIHDHHNDPNDPINRTDNPNDPRASHPYAGTVTPERQSMSGTTWTVIIAALLIVGGLFYWGMGDRTTNTASDGSAPASSTSTTPSTTGTGSNAPAAPRTTTGIGGNPSTPPAPPPASPAPSNQ